MQQNISGSLEYILQLNLLNSINIIMSESQPLNNSLVNHFLIATPKLDDPIFAESVVYICEHSADGAMGIIINKPSPVRMSYFFDALEKPTPSHFANKWALLGGPMQIERGFIVHSPIGHWQSSLTINDEIAVSISRDILEEMAVCSDTELQAVAAIGCSSWSSGQLEEELRDYAWLTAPADKTILFHLPYFKRYTAALNLLNFRPEQLMSKVGYA